MRSDGTGWQWESPDGTIIEQETNEPDPLVDLDSSTGGCGALDLIPPMDPGIANRECSAPMPVCCRLDF